MLRLLTFAERFRMDNPLTKCGSDVYQPNVPINLCYDTFAPPPPSCAASLNTSTA